MAGFDQATASRAVLIEVANVLGAFRDHLVVVGGWVPELLYSLFARDRGRQMFAALQKDKALLDAEFATPPVWTPGDYSEIRCTLDGASIQRSYRSNKHG